MIIPRHLCGWIRDWLFASNTWSSPRYCLSVQLRYIRGADGRTIARDFRAEVRRLCAKVLTRKGAKR